MGGYLIQPILVDKLDFIRFEDLVISDFLRMYVFFVIGVYLSLDRVTSILDKTSKEIHMILMLLAALFWIMLSTILRHKDFIMRWDELLPALSGIILFILLSFLIGKSKHLEFLGRFTLPIYVLHALCISIIRVVMVKFGLLDYSGMTALLICTLMGVYMPVVAYYICLKLGISDYFFYPAKVMRNYGRLGKNG